MKKNILLSLSLLLMFGATFAGNRDLPGVTIVPRSQRGANEAWRFSAIPYADLKQKIQDQNAEELDTLSNTDLDKFIQVQKAQFEKDKRNEYLIAKYPSEQKIDATKYEDNGNYLKWPQSYHFVKTKIVIHHTASNDILTGKEDVMRYLNDVYKFHTFSRQWGDLGYNFLIGTDGTIYEGRAGGEGVIAAHASRNNTPSLGIALIGNFDKIQPTAKQLESLLSLLTALAKKYSIDPQGKAIYQITTSTDPFMKTIENYTIIGHKDISVTSCPGVNLYKLLPNIRSLVNQRLSMGVLAGFQTGTGQSDTTNTTSIASTAPTTITNVPKLPKGISALLSRNKTLDNVTNSLKDLYYKTHTKPASPSPMQKMVSQISLQEVKTTITKNIGVLLYDLSTKFTSRNVSCDGECKVTAEGKDYFVEYAKIENRSGSLYLILSDQTISTTKIQITSNLSGLVTVTNYARESYAKIPRNTFRGSLIFEKQVMKSLATSQFIEQYVVINNLPFTDYLKGIAETTDSESAEKIKVMALLAKTYALFYMNGKNPHPSIPKGVNYQAIDHPDLYQKYVGAGMEKTLKKRPVALSQTKNIVLLYKDAVPILPYFSCSAGFTMSAKDKRGWTDTPYLQSRIDLIKCPDFAGHGVGLSGKGAQYFASKGRTRKQIIAYYYPGIDIRTLNK